MALSAATQGLYKFLAAVSCAEDAQKEQQWISEIEQRQRMFSSSEATISSESLKRLGQSRVSISRSLLRCPSAQKSWHDANTLIHYWLLHDKNFTLEDLVYLNAVLCNNKNPEWRKDIIYTCGVKHIDACEIEIIMQKFFKHLNSHNNNYLYKAFMCRYWIVSIHPFAEANGRTSQLLADYFLLKQGYPPQAFRSMVEALIVGHPVYRPYMTPYRAFKRFTQTVLNAYDILYYKL